MELVKMVVHEAGLDGKLVGYEVGADGKPVNHPWVSFTDEMVEIQRQRAQIIFRFYQEGWDIAELGNDNALYYLKIAFGQMLPELFVEITDPLLKLRIVADGAKRKKGQGIFFVVVKHLAGRNVGVDRDGQTHPDLCGAELMTESEAEELAVKCAGGVYLTTRIPEERAFDVDGG